MSGQRVCVSDFEEEARKVLPKAVYDYYRSGADEQISLADNVSAFNRYSTHTQTHMLSNQITIMNDHKDKMTEKCFQVAVSSVWNVIMKWQKYE